MAAPQIKFKVLPIAGNKNDVLVREDSPRLTAFSQVMPRDIGLLLGVAPEMKMLLMMMITSIELNEKAPLEQIIKQAKIIIEGIESEKFMERYQKDGKETI